MATKSEIKAATKYNATNTKLLQIRLNFKTDADIIARLEAVSSKMGYVKKLIRKDMVNNKREGKPAEPERDTK